MTELIDNSVVISGCGWVAYFVTGSIPQVLASAQALATDGSGGTGRYRSVRRDVLEPYGAASAEVRREESVWLAGAALEIAVADAGLERGKPGGDRIGLVLGCALAGQSGMIDFADDVRAQSARFVSPIRFPQTVGNYVSGALARAYDLRGPASTIACGSASSLEAIIEGCGLLTSGAADAVIAGGAERLTASLVEGMDDPCVAYADGACLFVLERAADANKRGSRTLGALGATPRGQAEASSTQTIVSTAGFREPGAVFIEAWTGRTLGADGAAALAAAIGAGIGKAVPIVDTDDRPGISRGWSAYDAVVGGAMKATIRAVDDRGFRRELCVWIPQSG